MILAPPVARWAVPLIPKVRYKGAKGGRSGGKSHQLTELAVTESAANPDYKVVCIREIQKSMRFSLKSLIESKIESLGVGHLFDIQDKVIKRRNGTGIFIFEGMQDHTADSLKGLESFDLALVDEANQLSARSLKLLTPTMRKNGSEIWFAWNPENEDDPVDAFFRDNEGHEDFVLVEVNITDNPFIGETGWKEYARAKALAIKKKLTDPNAWDEFCHIWLGDYNTRSDRFVFRNYRQGVIDTPENIVWFYGADWGFANDETAALRACVIETPKDERDILYIDSEAYEMHTPIEALPALLDNVIDMRKWPSRADSSRPETIDYMRRHGYSKMRRSRKGPGSVKHGVTFLQGFDIVINPTCVHLLKEMKNYSYKIDRLTEEVLPVIVDKFNHLIDALRYAVEDLHKKGKKLLKPEIEQITDDHDYGVDEDEGDENSWRLA